MTAPLFSPSGLSAIELCPRKFAYDKIDKVPRALNPYAEFGIATHKVIESYYLHGMLPDLGDPHGNAAAALLAHLPPPQPGIRVEEHRIVGRFHGYPDLTLGARVWDHKTTSDHKWAKTDLASDLQAALYAVFALQETGERKVVLQWNYVTRKKPRVLPVVQVVTLEDIKPTLERAHRLAEIGEDILEHRRPALSLKPNPEACEAYGGCQHRERCALSPAERMTAYQDRYRTEEPEPVKWYETLTETEREALFALMRRWDAESDEYMRKGRTNGMEIPVGAGLFDETIKGAVRLEWVMALRNATSFEDARAIAEKAVHLWVEKHNEKRPKDINWKRWTEFGQDDLLRLVHLTKEATMTTPQDFMSKMNASHPPVTTGAPPAPPAPGQGQRGNPWDGLPEDHLSPTMWYNKADPRGWVPKAEYVPPAAMAPPPPPPPPPAPTVPINPPAPPTAVQAPPPPPPGAPVSALPATPANPTPNWTPAPEPAPHAGSPVVAETAASPHEQIAELFDSLADAFRALGAAPPKARRGRPPKVKP